SSRRRHTRSKRDWSSDVCSSDLSEPSGLGSCLGSRSWPEATATYSATNDLVSCGIPPSGGESPESRNLLPRAEDPRSWSCPGARSEERRVGKECRWRWWRGPENG